MKNNTESRPQRPGLVLPPQASICEVGLRDGLQMERRILPTKMKLDIVKDLIAAGLRHIQVASFVNPRRLPQMADGEQLLHRLPEHSGVRYTGLALNVKGVERAGGTGIRSVEVSLSASDTHSRRNTGLSLQEAAKEMKSMIRLAQSFEMHIRASIQSAFGCAYEGRIEPENVIALARAFLDQGIDCLGIADTTGMADPGQVNHLAGTLVEIAAPVPVAAHFHDTQGMGLANVLTALQCGVIHFDAAMAGMGGCPFVPGAAGNIATEDTVNMMEKMGVATGIDIERLQHCSLQLEAFFEKCYPGKLHRLKV